MKISPDTNVLLRFILRDDEKQAQVAKKLIEDASVVAISLVALVEMVWVLKTEYAMKRNEIAVALRYLVGGENVVCNFAATEAGIELLEAGGDFADGVIAVDGHGLGGETFVTFDKRAMKLLEKRGTPVQFLS